MKTLLHLKESTSRVAVYRYRNGGIEYLLGLEQREIAGVKVWCWILPGGQREDFETPAECASRELGEEAGILANMKELHFTFMFRRGESQTHDYTDLFRYHLQTDGTPIPRDEKVSVYRWVKANDLPESVKPNHRRYLDTVTAYLSYRPIMAKRGKLCRYQSGPIRKESSVGVR